MSYRLNLRGFTTAGVALATLVTLVACAAPSAAPPAPATIAATIAAPTVAPTVAPAETPTAGATAVMTSTQAITGTAAMTNTAEANKAVVQRFYEEVVNQKNLGKMKDLIAPNFVAHDLGLKAGDLAETLTGMPDVKTTISLWVIEGDLVTAVVTWSGTHKGTLMGVTATGKPVSFSIIDIWRVKGSQLTELWHNVPNSDILAQISPPTATIAAPTVAPTTAPADTPTAAATAVMTSTQATTGTAAMTNTAAANQAVVQSFYEEVVNQKNLGKMKDLAAPNLVAHDLGLQAGDLGGVLTGMPDVKTTISLWVIEGDLVTAVVTFRGTHKGTLLGVAATGKPVSFSIIDIWRVKGSQLTELWHNVPNSDILAQISPPPAK